MTSEDTGQDMKIEGGRYRIDVENQIESLRWLIEIAIDDDDNVVSSPEIGGLLTSDQFLALTLSEQKEVIRESGLYQFLIEIYLLVFPEDIGLIINSKMLVEDFKQYLLDTPTDEGCGLLVDIWYERRIRLFVTLVKHLQLDVFTLRVNRGTHDEPEHSILWEYMIDSDLWDPLAVECMKMSVFIALKTSRFPSLFDSIEKWIRHADASVVRQIPDLCIQYIYYLWKKLGCCLVPTVLVSHESLCKIVNSEPVLEKLVSYFRNNQDQKHGAETLVCLSVPNFRFGIPNLDTTVIVDFYRIMYRDMHRLLRAIIGNFIQNDFSKEVSLIISEFLGIVPKFGNLHRVIFFEEKTSVESPGDEKVPGPSRKRGNDDSSSSNPKRARR